MRHRPRDQWIRANGLRIHYREWGNDGEPLVLLHGLASTSHIWDLVAPLLAKDFRVITPDQRGHGQTDKPPSGYQFDSVAKDLQSLLNAMKISMPIVIGHSWGCNVALEFAAIYPKIAKGLCLIDGGTLELSSRENYSLEKAQLDLAPPDLSGLTQEELRMRMRERSWLSDGNPDIENIVLENFFTLEDGTIEPHFSTSNHVKVIEALWHHKPSNLYRKIECPVLNLPSRCDPITGQYTQELEKERGVKKLSLLTPRSCTIWLENSVHDVPLQRPHLVASVIRERVLAGFFNS